MTKSNAPAQKHAVEETPKDRFLAELEHLDGAQLPQWFRDARESGAQQVRERDFPHYKEEDWRFTNIKPILRTSFAAAKDIPSVPESEPALEHRRLTEAAAAEFVFVNGRFVPELSRIEELPKGVAATSLREAGAEREAVLKANLDQHVTARSNMFTALNSAMFQDGALIHFTKGAVLERPIHLIYLTVPGDAPLAVFPRTLVVAEAMSQAAFVESHFCVEKAEGTYLTSPITEMVVGEGANLQHYKVTEESSNAFHMAGLRAHQGKDSVFRSFNFTLSGKIVRHDLSTLLDGEGGDCQLNGLYLTDSDQLVDNFTSIEHAQPHCTSWIGYKGVLDGKSRGVFTGHIMVRPGAQKTDSNQLNSNMLLSESATIDTKPQLEIFADDVKCTHGSTTGSPHERVIFYFRTRGMTEAMARGMLTYGFASEVVEQVGVEPLHDRLDRWVFDRYSPERHKKLPEKEGR